MSVDAADVVVVGAGTVGGWASVFARAHGAERVVVLEAATAGHGASSRAAGVVRVQGGTPQAVDLGRFSAAFYRGQRDRFGFDSGFRMHGYLILACDEQAVAAGRARVEMQCERGVAAYWVDPAEAAELSPLLDRRRLLGASYCAEDGAISPVRNVAAYLLAMRDAGVELREREPVLGVELRDGRVAGVRTPAGTIATERLILAGGVAQDALAALAGVAAPVAGSRHHVFVTEPRPELAAEPLAMGFDVAEGLYWRPEEGGLLFGMSDPNEAPGEARAIDRAVERRARTRLAELLPATAGLELRRAWAATIDYTPDHLPLLGSPVAGLTLASAAGHGMMWGPAVAQAAADLALTGATEVTDVCELGPERFDDDGNSSLAPDPIALPFPRVLR